MFTFSAPSLKTFAVSSFSNSSIRRRFSTLATMEDVASMCSFVGCVEEIITSLPVFARVWCSAGGPGV
eukprot:6148971-Pleurochrysis_carterae.AAC.1